jgi:hypothetical protein
MAEKGRVFTGARARFLLKGKKVGYATNVAGSEEIQWDPIEVLDNIQVEEFVPTAYRVTFTASLVRIIGETVKSLGFWPQQGTSPEEHLENILLQGELVAVIEDNKTGRAMMTLEQVKLASHNFTINARGIVGQDLTFVAIRMKDESEA